jgi:misacylated tRNA(Ala) deacylase
VQLLCQGNPEIFELEVEVLDARPGAVLLAQTPAFPGGGGQLSDRASIQWNKGEAAIRAITPDERGWWHQFEGEAEVVDRVRVSVDAEFRRLMCELHTLAHVTNSVVFQNFGGALLTGAQLSADGTFRVDFDLSGGDTDKLRALAGPINEVIRQDLPIRAFQMPWEEANSVPGLFRSKSVSPPRQADGSVRIVEIGDLDRQGCGGTHLSSTAQSRQIRILKVDNKGRQNRRVKVGFAESGSSQCS